MVTSLAFALAGATVFSSSEGCAAYPPASAAYALYYRPPLGKRLHYVLHVAMGASSYGMIFSVVATRRSPGKVTLITTIDSMNGPWVTPQLTRKLIAGNKVTEVVDESGQILSTAMVGPMKDQMKGASVGSVGAVFPRKPVRIGDTWRGTTEAAGPKTEVEVRLIGVKMAGGKQLAVLKMVPTATGYFKTGAIIATVEVATGVLHSMETAGGMGQGGRSMNVKMSLKLR